MAKVQKFINYVKEAFTTPMHLLGLTVATIAVALLMVILPALGLATVGGLAPLLIVLGALEMLYLGVMSRNKRFIRAVNSKYSKEIDEYHKSKAIAEYYNGLSAPRQRRFEYFKEKLDDIRTNYKNIHRNHTQIVNNFIEKVNNLQMNYIRLLYMQDKFPTYLSKENPDEIRKQIDVLKKSLEKESGKLKAIKIKRIRLMEKRIAAFGKAKENAKIIGAQLQTIEEMVNYIKDQPVALKNTDEETLMIDNILFETEQMENTISDIESIMNVGIVDNKEVEAFETSLLEDEILNMPDTVGGYGDMGMEGSGAESGKVTE